MFVKRVKIDKFMLKKLIYGIIIIVVLVIAYSLVVQITQAIKSGERLSQATDAVYQLQGKNKELKKKLSEIQSPQFIEQQARDKLGLSKKGETVVIIPDQTIKMLLGASSSAQIIRFPNPLGWWKVFFK